MVKKKETKVKTKDQKKYSLFKINLIILIVLLVLVLYFVLNVKPTIIGNAGGVIGVDFSAPIAAFQLDKTSMTFASLSETQTLLVSTNDNKVYKNAYYSTGTTWNKFQLSGTTLSSGWITGAASKTLSLKASDLNLNDTNLTKTLHVITYSCTKLSRNKFDCRNNLWQLKDINVIYQPQVTQATTPVASPVAGTYTSAQNVTLTSTTSGASIYYTTNGATPTTSSTLYSGAIPISATATLKAIATKSGYTNSSVLSASYTINTGTPNTYYISTTGTDGSAINGSISSPWKTLAYACSRVTTSGSTIHVNAGTYNETARCNLASGVSIVGVGDTSIIKTSYSAYNLDEGAIFLSSSLGSVDGNQSISYLKIDGNNLAGDRAIAVIYRNNVEIHHVTIVDFLSSAIRFKGNDFVLGSAYPNPNVIYSSGNKVHDCILSNNSTNKTNDPWGYHIILSGQNGSLLYNNTFIQTTRPAGTNGILIGGDYVKNLKIYNNTFTKNDQEGTEWNFFFEIWHWQGGGEIYHNIFNGDAVLDLSDVRKEEYAYGLKVYDNNFLVATNTIFNPHMVTPITFEDHGVIEYAYVYNNYFKNTSGGVAVTALVNETDTNVNVNHIYIYSNLFENIGCSNSNWAFPILINTTDSGTSIAGNVFWDTISIYNNTMLTTSSVRANTGIRFLLGGTATNVTIRNNIIQGFYKAIAFDKTITGATINTISIENNLYYNNAANVTNGTDYGAVTITNKTEQNNLTSNPLFVSTTDFHLQSGSPAIDKGINVELPFNGIAPDIGVYESNYLPANSYYIAPDGNDSASGDFAHPFATLTKAWGVVSAGYTIYLRGGIYVFNSQQVLSGKNGTSSNLIKVWAYPGETPVITFTNNPAGITLAGNYINFKGIEINGLSTISNYSNSGWTDQGNGIWKKTVASDSSINMVTIDNVNTAMGRYPNLSAGNQGYLTVDTHVSNTSIYDAALPTTPNFTGGEVLVRRSTWVMDRTLITNHSGQTITYAPYSGNSTGAPSDGAGYFIQNDLDTLDQVGEWYYSGTDFYMYFGSGNNPSLHLIKASTVDMLMYVNGSNNVTFDNMTFQGGNSFSLKAESSGNVKIQTSNFNYSGGVAIRAWNNSSMQITDNNMTNSNNGAISLQNCSNGLVSNNIITNTGTFAGMESIATDGQHQGIWTYVTPNLVIQYNRIINTGFNPINFDGNAMIIRNNYIDTFCYIKDDGAGIYTWNDDDHAITSGVRKVYNNIVVNGIGAYNGGSADGIYMDDGTDNVEIYNNTISNVNGAGIWIHHSFRINVHNNLFYNAGMGTIDDAYAIDIGNTYSNNPDQPVRNAEINNNIVFSTVNQKAVEYVSVVDVPTEITLFGNMNNNNYCFPLSSPQFHVTNWDEYVPSVNLTQTFAQWKAYSGKDSASVLCSKTVPNSSYVLFEYNDTNVTRTISLSVPYVDVYGTLYTGSVALQPYTSIVLMKN